jgi:shikimate kinase
MMKTIVLVGFMGSGKTAVGGELSARLGLPLVDLDQEIERLEGMPIADLFMEKGERYFRTREREVLQSLRGGDQVLSIGGGTYTSDDNISQALQAPPPLLQQGASPGGERRRLPRGDSRAHHQAAGQTT